jgi:alanyl-tRNA synthetase
LSEAATGQVVDLLLDRTPFYAESGGQVADTGIIETEYGRALVQDVQKPLPGVTAHRATIVSGTLRRGEVARATVDVERRWDIMRNHTATHLLHRALRDTLGEHAQQRGSLVTPDYLRFDFNHLDRLTDEQAEQIERIVNSHIRADYVVVAEEMPVDEAKRRGATMLFGEKYGDVVRVIAICDEDEVPETGSLSTVERPYSQELCGGTHLLRTGQIGAFLIAGEQSTGQGVRRITALTGRAAEEQVLQQRRLLRALTRRVGAQQPEQLEERVEKIQQQIVELDRQLSAFQRDLSRGQMDSLLDEVQQVNGVRVLAARVTATSMDNMREMSDWLRDKLGSAFVVLGAEIGDKPLLVAAATPDVVERGGHAGKLVGAVARTVGGGGGGRPDFAQAGGRDLSKLQEALSTVPGLVREQLHN